MKTFLHHVAKEILHNHPTQLGQMAILLPSRRAVAYLKEEFKNINDRQTVWLPEIFAIEDFIFYASGYAKADPTSLLIELYKIHTSIQKDPEGLEDFIGWGNIMLQDFNAIDENLADAHELFHFLSEAKAIESWRPDQKELSEYQKRYVRFFQNLSLYYQELRKNLLADKKAYSGMAMRALYDSGILLNQSRWQHFVFAGFYALTQAEKELIGLLKKHGKVTELYDTDHYYTGNTSHEAGNFLRKNAVHEGFQWNFNYYKEKTAGINIYGIPGNIGQARQVGEILHQLTTKEDIKEEDIAIVLADEKLLFPVMNSIPENIKQVNVTMGFPVRYTATSNLIQLILKILRDQHRFQRKSFHINELIEIINQPVIRFLTNHKEKLKEALLGAKKIFFSPEEVKDLLPATLIRFLGQEKKPDQILQGLIDLMHELQKHKAGSKAETMEQYAATMIADRLLDIQQAEHLNEVVQNFKHLEKIMVKSVLSDRMPFAGNPRKGVQLMGMLESRALDFKYVIITSVNEGALPAGKSQNSLIPFDIRKKFHLPTYADNDSIYAYHFYRLLQRSQHTYLLYNTETTTLGGNEKSRFVHQLLQELNQYNPQICICETILSPQEAKAQERNITIEKDAQILKDIQTQISQNSNKGLSASGLRTLTRCSLQYYFRYILGLRKPDDVEETIPMNIFGNAVHQVLENLYNPEQYGGPYFLKPEHLDKLDMQQLFIQNLPVEYSEAQLKSGRNRLMVELATNFLNRFITNEQEFLKQHKVKILEVEKEYKTHQVINGLDIAFKGFADRIDEVDGKIRIIDYKTGNVKPDALTQTQQWDTLAGLKSGEAIQVLFYDWVYSRVNNNQDTKDAGIIALAKPSHPALFFKHNKNQGINQDVRMQFEKALTLSVEDLLNPLIPFSQTEDKKICDICDFSHICNR
ncbi:MAG: PD-(D/E)XK nuclease family protein [Bacteroidota bacterium]